MTASLSLQDVANADDQSYDRLGLLLDGLSDDGHVFDVETGSVAPEKRHKIALTYLWLLGYSEANSPTHVKSRDFEKALKRFQSHLGREQSGELDEFCWQALTQLAPFDTESNIQYWFSHDSARPLVSRAVHLRLYSYGLIESLPPRGELRGAKLRRYQKKFSEGLKDFARICSLLGYVEAPLSATLDSQLIALLFDHKKLLHSLPVAGNKLDIKNQHPDYPLEEKKRLRLLKHFTDKLALVELWLLGYDVRPGNIMFDLDNLNQQYDSLKGALKKYARERHIDSSIRKASHFHAWFFADAQNLEPDSADANDDLLASPNLNGILADNKRRKALEKSYQSLGARIIDGVKKAFTWVFNLFRKAVRAIKSLMRNLARTLAKGAFAIYERLKAIMRVVAIGFDYFFTSPVGGSSTDAVYVSKSVDFDFTVVVNPACTRQRVIGFFHKLELRIRAMELGGLIIGQIWQLVKFAIKTAGSILGWLEMLIVLVKLRNWIKRSVALSRESLLLVRELDATAA
jgi:hypothetical protein